MWRRRQNPDRPVLSRRASSGASACPGRRGCQSFHQGRPNEHGSSGDDRSHAPGRCMPTPERDARGRAAERARARSARLNAQKGRFPSKLTTADRTSTPPGTTRRPTTLYMCSAVACVRTSPNAYRPALDPIGRHGRSAQPHCSQSQCWSATETLQRAYRISRAPQALPPRGGLSRPSMHECTMTLTGAPAALRVRRRAAE